MTIGEKIHEIIRSVGSDFTEVWDDDLGNRPKGSRIMKITEELWNSECTVDAIPVVHAHWEYGQRTDGYWVKGNKLVKCSNCGREFNTDNNNCWWWCPQCGAKMDGECKT